MTKTRYHFPIEMELDPLEGWRMEGTQRTSLEKVVAEPAGVIRQIVAGCALQRQYAPQNHIDNSGIKKYEAVRDYTPDRLGILVDRRC